MSEGRPPRVVLVCSYPRDERYGTSKVTLRLASELGRVGLDVTALFAEDLPRVANPRAELITGPLRVARALIARAADADLVEIAGLDGWLYARWARRRRRAQAVVCRSNGLWYRSLPFKGLEHRSRARQLASAFFQKQVVCRFESSSISGAHLAVFNTRAEADVVVSNGWKRSDEVAVISPGVDDDFASSVPLTARKGMFYVGTFIHQKGGDVAADAFSLVLLRHPDATATFIGPGTPDAEIRARFDPTVQARVTILPKLPASDVARELAGGAVLLFPSLYEGFGMVVLEAMRAGLVVVSTQTGAGGEVVRDGENGLHIPFSDVGAAAAALDKILSEPALRIRLATAAMNEASGRTWRVAATGLADAYRRAIALAAAGRTP